MSDELAGLVFMVLVVYLLAGWAAEEQRCEETVAAIWMLEQGNRRRT